MAGLAEPAIIRPTEPYGSYGAAREFWRYTGPEALISGPAGTGKSRACLEKIHAALLRWPGSRALAVRKTRESLTESALVTFETKVLPPGDPIAAGAQRKMRQAYHYPNGSELIIGGLDKPSKVMSTEYDLIYVQEAIETFENDWESLTTRLRNGVMPFQQIIADTNPDAPTHWLYRRCQLGKTKLFDSRHEDNPTLWTGTDWTPSGKKYLAKLDSLTGARHDRLRHGKWVQAEGVVYPDWNTATHYSDPFPIPPDWRRIRAIDFGYSNPFVCQWYALDPDDRLYLYRELYHSKRTVRRHAKQIRELSRDEVFAYTVADHDAEDRATLREEGIDTVPAKKATTVGRQAVEERLKIQGDGKPRFFVFRNALVERDPDLFEAKRPCCTAEEFDAYIWPKGQDGKAIKEEPIKDNDHGMDALRYAVMSLARHISPHPESPQAQQERERREAEERRAAQQSWLNVNNPAMWE